MKKIYHLLFVLLPLTGVTQTIPAPFQMCSGNYALSDWASTEAAGTYPANMIFHVHGTQTPTIATSMTANYTLAYSSTSGTRVQGRNTSGFSFTNVSGSMTGGYYNGAAVIALNTIGREDISVSWNGIMWSSLIYSASMDRNYSIRLQYRIGGIGDFVDVPGPVEFTSLSSATSYKAVNTIESFSTILPDTIENHNLVEVRWTYFQLSGVTGTRPTLGIDEISVTSTAIAGGLQLSINPAQPKICPGDSATITANGANTFSWEPSTGLAGSDKVVKISPAATATYTVTGTDGCNNTAALEFEIVVAPISTTFTSTPITCRGDNDGTITAMSIGGSGVYTYLWNDSVTTAATISSVPAGEYTVVVSDENNCTDTATYILTEPDPLVITPAIQDVSCNGLSDGSAEATVTGGTGAYTYSWDQTGSVTNTISGVPAGSYILTVTDAKNCSADSVIIIGEPAVLTATTTVINISCFQLTNGQATIIAEGGTRPYTYSWTGFPSATDSVLTDLAEGTYNYTVTDANGCTTNGSFNITAPTELTAQITANTNVTCGGGMDGSATVQAAGGTGNYTYSWNSNPSQSTETAINLMAGDYTVTVTDTNNCSVSKTVTITEPDSVKMNATIDHASCLGINNGVISLFPSGGNGSYTYSWEDFPGDNSSSMSGLAAGTYTVVVSDGIGCKDSAGVVVNEGIQISATFNRVDAACYGYNGGVAEVIPSGGTEPYNYSWTHDGSITPDIYQLEAGTYTVVVTDDVGCQGTFDVTILQPDTITATFNTTNVSCYGLSDGEAVVIPAGGNGQFTFDWGNSEFNDSIANLSAGIYSVIVTDVIGCAGTFEVEIFEPDTIILTFNTTNPICNSLCNGSISVSATGGNGVFSYSWDTGETGNSVTGVCAGIYIVTVTDNLGCTKTDSATISQPDMLIISSVITNPICNSTQDGSIDITVSGGTGSYTYSWSNNDLTEDLTGVEAGSYMVVVTDNNNCSEMGMFSLTAQFTPTVNLGADTSICNGDSMVLNAGSFSSYLWSDLSSDPTLTVDTSGSYYVEVTDVNGCVASDTIVVDVSVCASVISLESAALFNVYPNPASEIVYLDIREKSLIEIIDIRGRILISEVVPSAQKLEISNLSAGVYTVKASAGKHVQVAKLIVK